MFVTTTTGSITNNGENARWRPFTEFIQTGRFLSPVTGKPLIPVINPATGLPSAFLDPDTGAVEPRPVPEPLATGIHRLVSMVDPVTGRTRLIAVTDQGVYTGVDRG